MANRQATDPFSAPDEKAPASSKPETEAVVEPKETTETTKASPDAPAKAEPKAPAKASSRKPRSRKRS